MFASKSRILAAGKRTFRKFSTGRANLGTRVSWFAGKKLSLFAAAGLLSAYGYTKFYQPIGSMEPEKHTVVIGESRDFLEGQMREIQVGATDKDTILIVKIDGELYACGSKCSHFGAPLSKGMLFDDRIYCPFHLASFSAKTGYPDNGPMMDGIPTYKIWEESGKVHVEVPKKLHHREPVPTCTRDPNNKERYVIVGGGIAASSAADTLR